MTKQTINYPKQDFQLDILLDEVCAKLQLDATRRAKAETAYNYVTKWIEDDSEFFGNLKPELFPYGSYSIGTTVKPLSRDEFDLDFAVMVFYDRSKISVQSFLGKLYKRLNENGKYKGKVERLRFCVRIKYDSDFHLDIMPGCNITNTDKMVVPDTKRNYWPIRNPKGYEEWFKGLFIKDLNLLRSYQNEKYNFIKLLKSKVGGTLPFIGKTEELPQQVPYELVQPLQKAVQLLKRHRDIYFKNTPDLATSSVILTTIAGRFYKDDVSIYESLNNIIDRIYNVGVGLDHGKFIEITNPADDRESQKERFSDKWIEKPQLYEAFWKFIVDTKIKWERLKSETTKEGKAKVLIELFGEGIGRPILEDDELWNISNEVSPRFSAPPSVITPPKPGAGEEAKLAALARRQKPWRE